MRRWRLWPIAVAFLVAPTSIAAAQPVPDYVDHPLSLLQRDWVQPDPSNNGVPITFFGIGDLDRRCAADTAFMTLAEAVALATVYYSYAENAFRGDFSTWRPGYPMDHDLFDGAPIGAIDLLKQIDPSALSGMVQFAMDQLDGRERDLARAALAALLGRYQPVTERLDAVGDDLSFLLEQLAFPSYERNVISEFGLPQDGDPCFSAVFYFNVRIGDETSYAAIRSMDHYLDSFWVRRYAEGSYRLVHSLLQQAEQALQHKP